MMDMGHSRRHGEVMEGLPSNTWVKMKHTQGSTAENWYLVECNFSNTLVSEPTRHGNGYSIRIGISAENGPKMSR